jgi:hypothetical protein
MNKTTILILIIMLSLVVCTQRKSGWNGTVEMVEGVSIVKNPQDPIYGGDIFNLNEDLSVGKAEGDDEYIFSQINDFDVDNEGNIYAIDNLTSQVRVFDKTGKFARTVGRKGQGPGEMQMPGFIQITSQREVLVVDYSTFQFIFFSLDGTFVRQKSIGRPVLPAKLDSRGNLIGMEILAPPPVGGKILRKYDSNFTSLMEIAEEKQGQRGVIDIGKPSCLCDVTSEDYVVWGNSELYELQVLNPEGKLVKKIQKKHDPVTITSRDKEIYETEYSEFVKRGGKLNFRDHFPAFMDMSIDDQGRIWVKTYERQDSNGDAFLFDVFDSEGKYIAKIPIRANLNRNSVWKKGKLYTLETDDKGFQSVKRYATHWKY